MEVITKIIDEIYSYLDVLVNMVTKPKPKAINLATIISIGFGLVIIVTQSFTDFCTVGDGIALIVIAIGIWAVSLTTLQHTVSQVSSITNKVKQTIMKKGNEDNGDE